MKSNMDQFYQEIKQGDLVWFNYTNWQGKLAERKAIVKGFFFGKTNYHTDYQMFMIAFDIEKMAIREFAVKDISSLQVVEI
jgi:hypothetical protein